MNAKWQVTARYTSAMATVLGVFTFEEDAQAFAQSARRRWSGATISVQSIDVRVEVMANA